MEENEEVLCSIRDATSNDSAGRKDFGLPTRIAHPYTKGEIIFVFILWIQIEPQLRS